MTMCLKFATLHRKSRRVVEAQRWRNGGAPRVVRYKNQLCFDKQLTGEIHREAAMCNRVNGRAPGTASRSGHARIGVSIVAMACLWLSTDARAETIGGALAKAYLNNPNLNQQRAAVRAA